MTLPKIAIIISTTREGRFGDRPAQWMLEQARAHGGAEFEIVDLRDHDLPFFNEPAPIAQTPSPHPAAQRWARAMASFDGYIFVTAEYNHGVPGVLKNALDHAYAEYSRKPAAFVGYGGVGAARAIEQLRLILIEFQIAPLRSAVHIGTAELAGIRREGKNFNDYPHLVRGASQLLTTLLWWTEALRAGREAAT